MWGLAYWLLDTFGSLLHALITKIMGTENDERNTPDGEA